MDRRHKATRALDGSWNGEQAPPLEDKALFVFPQDVTRQGLAAFCLWDQDFGFTREDVRVLRETEARGPRGVHLLSMADRIEALIPPEEE